MVASTLTPIGSEPLVSRKVQNVVSHQTTGAGSSLSTTPLGRSTISTLAPAEVPDALQSYYVPLRPVLEPATAKLEDGEMVAVQKFLDQALDVANDPEANPEIRKAYLKIVCDIHAIAETVTGNCAKHMSAQIRTESAELDRLQAKQAEIIRERVLASENKSTWSFLSKIMQYFLSAASVVLGGVLVATGVGATAGAFLIAAGGLGLLDSIAKDTGAYLTIASYFAKSKAMQETIANWISTAILFTTIGLGVTGGVMSSLSGGVEAARTSINAVNAAKKLEVAIGLATAGVAVGKAASDNRTAQIQKALQLMEGRIVLLKQTMQTNVSEAKETISMMQIITQQAAKAMRAFN